MRKIGQHGQGPHRPHSGQIRTFCSRLLGVNDALLEEGRGGKTDIYVDDATMVLWAKSELDKSDGTPGLNRMAYEVAAEWTYMVVDLLKLQTSDKNVFMPDGAPARVTLRGCQLNNCTASINSTRRGQAPGACHSQCRKIRPRQNRRPETKAGRG